MVTLRISDPQSQTFESHTDVIHGLPMIVKVKYNLVKLVRSVYDGALEQCRSNKQLGNKTGNRANAIQHDASAPVSSADLAGQVLLSDLPWYIPQRDVGVGMAKGEHFSRNKSSRKSTE